MSKIQMALKFRWVGRINTSNAGPGNVEEIRARAWNGLCTFSAWRFSRTFVVALTVVLVFAISAGVAACQSGPPLWAYLVRGVLGIGARAATRQPESS